MNHARATVPGGLCVCLVAALAGCGSPGRVEERSDQILLQIDTPVGIEARETLESPRPSDAHQVQLVALRILLGPDETDGSWEHDPTATGKALLDLHRLNVIPRDDPAVRRAVAFLLDRNVSYLDYGADSPAWGKDWIALYAVNRWGYGEELRVRETVHTLIDNLSAWLEGQDGRTASAILRAITVHPLVKQEKRDLLVEKLGERQLPTGAWELGPGTSVLAVLGALLPLAKDGRVMEQINRFLPLVKSGAVGPSADEDRILTADEAHLVIVQALKLAGKLESYRKGENLEGDFAPFEIGLYVVARAGEKGHVLPFDGRSLTIVSEPVLLGTDIVRWRELLSPDKGEGPLMRLFLEQSAREKLDRLVAADAAVEVALLLRGEIIAVQRLAELRDRDGLAVKGMAREDAARLIEAVGKIEGKVEPAIGSATQDRPAPPKANPE
jgi:hypothetical protein